MTNATQPNSTLRSNENLGLLLGLIGVLIFSGSLPATRIAVADIHPVWVALARVELAAVLSLIAIVVLKVPAPPKHLWKALALTSFGVTVGFPIFSSVALYYTDASHGAIINGLLPLATAIVAVHMAREKPSFAFWASAIAGSLVVIAYAAMQSNGTLQIGDVYMFIAVIGGAIGYANGGKVSQVIGGWQTICWALVVAAPVLLAPTLWMILNGSYALKPVVSPQAWLGLAYVTVMSQWIGFFFWYGGMAVGGVSRVSQVQLLQLFFTLLLAALINNESIQLMTWLVAVVVVGIIVLNKKAAVQRSSSHKDF